MKTTYEMHLLRFYAQVWDSKTMENREESIVLSKDQLRAAGLIGQSSKELITRLFARKGLEVLSIGKPDRQTVVLDLDTLWECCGGGEEQGASLNPIEMMEALDGEAGE